MRRYIRSALVSKSTSGYLTVFLAHELYARMPRTQLEDEAATQKSAPQHSSPSILKIIAHSI